jgi:hypothetical protein
LGQGGRALALLFFPQEIKEAKESETVKAARLWTAFAFLHSHSACFFCPFLYQRKGQARHCSGLLLLQSVCFF